MSLAMLPGMLLRSVVRFVVALGITAVVIFGGIFMLGVTEAVEDSSIYSDAVITFVADGGWKKFLAVATGGIFGFLFFDPDFDMGEIGGGGGGAAPAAAAARTNQNAGEEVPVDFYGA